jgi:hypothetical protein
MFGRTMPWAGTPGAADLHLVSARASSPREKGPPPCAVRHINLGAYISTPQSFVCIFHAPVHAHAHTHACKGPSVPCVPLTHTRSCA